MVNGEPRGYRSIPTSIMWLPRESLDSFTDALLLRWCSYHALNAAAAAAAAAATTAIAVLILALTILLTRARLVSFTLHSLVLSLFGFFGVILHLHLTVAT